MEYRDFQRRVLDGLDEVKAEIVGLKIDIAQFPHLYVSRNEFEEARTQARLAKRWAISTLLTSALVLIALVTNF